MLVYFITFKFLIFQWPNFVSLRNKKKQIKKYFLKNLAPKKWKTVKINWSGHESAISELIVLVFIFKQLNWFKQQHCDIVDIRHIKNTTWVNFSYLFHSTSQTAYFFHVCPKMAQQRFFLPPNTFVGIWTRDFERSLYRLSYRDHGLIFNVSFWGETLPELFS